MQNETSQDIPAAERRPQRTEVIMYSGAIPSAVTRPTRNTDYIGAKMMAGHAMVTFKKGC